MKPAGPGPWFCTLFFNTSKNLTHLLPHDHPHLALDFLNKRKNGNDSCWVIIIKIGKFECWEDCLAFYAAWKDCGSKGKKQLLERGFQLMCKHHVRYKLRLWAQDKSANEALAQYNETFLPPKKKKRQKAQEEEGVALFPTSFDTVKQVKQFHQQLEPKNKKKKN